MGKMEKPWLKFYHSEVAEFADIKEESLYELVRSAAARFGDATAITFYQKTFSFKEVLGITEHYAACLHAEGFQKGDRIAIMLPNTPHYLFSLFAAFRVGGIAAQVNPMYVEREIEHVLKDSGAKFIVVLDILYPRVKAVQKQTQVEKVIVVSLTQQSVDLQEGDVMFDDFLKSAAAKAPDVHIDAREDVAVLQYTGGTTGVSKGVMLTHYNLQANVEQIYNFMFKTLEDMPANPKVMAVLPMFHIYGLTCNGFQGFRAGCNQIVLPRFDVQEVMETVQRETPFQMSGVPTMYVALNSQPNLEQYGFDKISYYNSGGAAMPVEQLYLFEKRTGRALSEGYGLSEASPVTHFNPSFTERRAGSIGIPLPNTDAKLVRETPDGVEEVAVGEVGELIIKGPQVMKGYWNMPEETAAVLKDGWLFTGDMAYRNEEGYFYIADRKKDMIIAGGFNIYPREVEEVLYQHPAVQEVVVIGIPDEYRGENVKAYVTLNQGVQITEEELITFSREHLAAYKAPRFVEFRDQMPKSAVGKLLRRKLRDEEMQKTQQTF